MRKFWYVSRDPSTVGYHDPKTAYFSLDEAKAFAEKMVKTTGHDFYVMESVQMVKPAAPPVKWLDVIPAPAKRLRDEFGRFVPVIDDYDC